MKMQIDIEMLKECIGVEEKDLLRILSQKYDLELENKEQKKRIDGMLNDSYNSTRRIAELIRENNKLKKDIENLKKTNKKKNHKEMMKLKEEILILKSNLCDRIIAEYENASPILKIQEIS